MITVLALLLAIVTGFGMPVAARAQSGEAGGFLDPFPEGDRYRVQVWGDNMAEGLLEGLAEAVENEPRFQVERRLRWLGSLLRLDIEQEVRSIDAALAVNRPHIVVAMLGMGDRVPIRRGSNRRAFPVGSDEWQEEYTRRLDLLMKALRKRSVAVIWVGLPVMRRQDVTEDVETLNEIFRARALANGARFVDVFTSFADADKGYSSHGPDIAGKVRLLRDPDGIHFSGAGYRRLAYFIERELKRAATEAWDERTIPLAGTEAEQSRIRPQSVRLAPLAVSGAPGAPGAAGGGSVRAGPRSISRPATDGDGVAADNSRIILKSIGEQGREESFTIEIPRPAIPAAVVSMMTRRESADKPTHIGETVMTEILGGLTVVSSVTSLSEQAAERRRGGLDQSTPLHRVLHRGESLPPKPGRADELPWPRPEPVLDPRLSQAAAAASATLPGAPGASRTSAHEPASASSPAGAAPQKRAPRPAP